MRSLRRRRRELAVELGDPFREAKTDSPDAAAKPSLPDSGAHNGRVGWRTLLLLPLAGPIVITGFFS